MFQATAIVSFLRVLILPRSQVFASILALFTSAYVLVLCLVVGQRRAFKRAEISEDNLTRVDIKFSNPIKF